MLAFKPPPGVVVFVVKYIMVVNLPGVGVHAGSFQYKFNAAISY